jgi:hypothetical protein
LLPLKIETKKRRILMTNNYSDLHNISIYDIVKTSASKSIIGRVFCLMKSSRGIFLSLLFALAATGNSLAVNPPAASAQISSTPMAGGIFHYTVTLNNTGTAGDSPIGTFWFGWVPGEDFMAVKPTGIVTPTGWEANITNAGTSDGFAIQWVASKSTAAVAPGASLSFSFNSTATPAEMDGNSIFYPSTRVETAFVYSGAPFSDAGFEVAVQGTSQTDLYLVYSGMETQSIFEAGSTSALSTKQTATVYLVFDLSNPGSYSVLSTTSSGASGTYAIFTRVLNANGSAVTSSENGAVDSSSIGTDPAQNFIASVANEPSTSRSGAVSSTKGYTVFKYGGTEGTDPVTINSSVFNYLKVHQIYLTGLLTGLSDTTSMTVVPADAKPKVSGVYTVNAIPSALTNFLGTAGSSSTQAYPTELTGSDIRYEYLPSLSASPVSGAPALNRLSLTGTTTLTLNTTLTSLANVGGSFKLKGQLTPTTISPVATQLNATSSPTVYEDFLFEITQSLGLPSSYVPAP